MPSPQFKSFRPNKNKSQNSINESVRRPPSLEELKKIRPTVRNVNIEHKEGLGRLEHLAIWVTDHVGSMGFFLVIITWTSFWLLWNIFGPKAIRFDPYPAFVLWLFISNVIQLTLGPLIMVGQNLQGRHSEARAEVDFEINVRAEREIEAVLMHLEYQNDLILKILRRLEAMEEARR